jgi:phosphoribosylanthranilate isomerase
MSTWIKICGITDVHDARLAVDLGADAIGLVMHTASPRACDPQAAKGIVRELRDRILCVGVWLDECFADISSEAEAICFSAVQNYDLATSFELARRGFPCIPAVHQGMSLDSEVVQALRGSEMDRVILDRSRSGKEVQSRNFPPAWTGLLHEGQERRIKIILAGGLNEENVCSVLSRYEPHGVDVSSGIESQPGKKDPDKLRHFIAEVRKWDSTAISAGMAGGLCRKR